MSQTDARNTGRIVTTGGKWERAMKSWNPPVKIVREGKEGVSAWTSVRGQDHIVTYIHVYFNMHIFNI